MSPIKSGRGAALVELMCIAAVLAILAAMLVAGGSESRRQAMLGDSLGNLKRIHRGHMVFAADKQDFVATFTWQAGHQNSQWEDLNNSSTDLQAAADQAVDIIRRLSGRGPGQAARITQWVPQIFYSHLALADHLGEELPARWMISPADQRQLLWADHHASFPAGVPQPAPGGGNNSYRWAYAGSYELPPAFYTPDVGTQASPTLTQGQTHDTFFIPGNTTMGERRHAEVLHPSSKVLLYDRWQRHFGARQAFFMYEEARLPLAMADGSASVRRTDDANRGFRPDQPLSGLPTTTQYNPAPWEPPAPSGVGSTVYGHYRWTRSGLRGRDFGGPEVPWVP